jgi:mono/diheme cytochrome c family protein
LTQAEEIAQRFRQGETRDPVADKAVAHMKSAPYLLLLLPLCLAAPLARSQTLAVFTAEQAEQGKVLYARNCASCHGPDLEGASGPALTGPDFKQMLTDQNRTAASLLDVIRFTMPYDAQGNLPDAQFDAITAYILSRAGYPAGSEKLGPDNPHLAELKLGS